MVTSAAYEDDVECYWYERPLAQPLKVQPLFCLPLLLPSFASPFCIPFLRPSFASLFYLPFLPPPFPHRYLSLFFRLLLLLSLQAVREYFGEKVALYFSWLGHYTFWLLFPAIVGPLMQVSTVIMSLPYWHSY